MTSVHRRVTQWTGAHPKAVDALVTLVAALAAVLGTVLLAPVGSERSADVFAYVLVLAASATLWWRRTNPLVALPACVLFTITFWVADYAGAVDPALWLMFYAATRHGGHDRRAVWRLVGGALAVVTGVSIVGFIVPSEDLSAFHVLGVLVVHLTAAVVGEALYQRSQYVRELELRAEALEADLQTQSVLAAVEERTRIAREMHDIVAHGMTSVVVQAQAAQSLPDDESPRMREILATIESIGRDSVNEMRRMLGVLRDPGSAARLGPQPTLADCRELIDRACEAGVDATLEVTGHERPAPPGVELTGYRVVQEALTNVVRHAGRPVAARVAIDFGAESVEISIVDDGLGAAAMNDSAGSGHGVLGMRERVEVYNGSFRAEPRPGGGYQVRASLPIAATVRA